MKMIVTARDYWDERLQKVFGEGDSIYNFPDNTKQFLKIVEPFGRFEILGLDKELPTINFQNGYD